MRVIIQRSFVFLTCLLVAFTAVTSSAQTFTKLLDFQSKNGALPFHTSLIQGFDGNLYGTTSGGGSYTSCRTSGCGTLFGVTTSGNITKVFGFNFTNGASPQGGLIEVANGTFFGTTSAGSLGGTGGGGSVFELTSTGKLVTIHAFCSQANCSDGDAPDSGLIRATNGYFYGTTCNGGTSNSGTIYRISPAGTFTVLHSFNGLDGSCPYGPLIQASNGKLYGAASGGGANQFGTLFTLTLDGTLTLLHTFNGPPSDGSFPQGGMAQASDGNLYGTTLLGGDCPAATYGGCGTIFRLTPSGAITTVYNFCLGGDPCADGEGPGDGLVVGSDNNLYGSTGFGGTVSNAGTIFSFALNGTLTTLHSFDNTYTDGKYPLTTLLQGTDGKFYGTAEEGGAKGKGTLFSLDMGLAPFVAAHPSSGKVGVKISILGGGLTGATVVNFNGTPAAFTVLSDTQISATVPAGATSGALTVTTPTESLTSNVAFQVLR